MTRTAALVHWRLPSVLVHAIILIHTVDKKKKKLFMAIVKNMAI